MMMSDYFCDEVKSLMILPFRVKYMNNQGLFGCYGNLQLAAQDVINSVPSTYKRVRV